MSTQKYFRKLNTRLFQFRCIGCTILWPLWRQSNPTFLLTFFFCLFSDARGRASGAFRGNSTRDSKSGLTMVRGVFLTGVNGVTGFWLVLSRPCIEQGVSSVVIAAVGCRNSGEHIERTQSSLCWQTLAPERCTGCDWNDGRSRRSRRNWLADADNSTGEYMPKYWVEVCEHVGTKGRCYC